MTVTDLNAHRAAATDDERPLPCDIDAEQIVLGAAITDPRALREIVEILASPLDLYRPAHQIVLQTLLDMNDNNQPLGPISLNNELNKRGQTQVTGGAPYIHELVAAAPLSVNGGYYARIVADKADLRRIVQAGTRIAQLGYDGYGETTEIFELATTALEQATSARNTEGESDTERLGADLTFFDELATPLDETRKLPAPYADLTEATAGGFERGELVCVAGRTGSGKSVVGLDIARNAAIRQGHPVLYASLEMPRRLVRERIHAAEAKVPLHAIKKHELTDADWQKLAAAWPGINEAPLYISTPAKCTIGLLRQRLQAMQRRGAPAQMAVVDHVGLMQSAGRVENRYTEISAYSRGLKLLAMEFDIPVIMLCQVNRTAGNRSDAIPRISDLRDSGSLEQDSDIVLMVHREDYDVADKEKSARSGEVDLYLAKNRSGPTAVVTLAGQLHYARFVDMAKG